ncbi:MAG: hypothetical protein FJY88_07550, partial [Candidatus Eisenbacteria bacterium]|nr:hypothetical protein [Candidatus Eisenbacteria bacterium]
MSKRVLLGGLALLAAFALPAMAGRNSGGAILLHTNDTYTYSAGTRCTTELARPANCAGVITRTDKDSRPVIW